MPNVVGRKKVFKLFTYLPNELQMMVVDEMEPADRCRFTRTSISCSKKARSSKKYIYELHFCLTADQTSLMIKHGVDENFRMDFDQGFQLNFVEELGKKYVKCLTLTQKELWVTKIDNSIDLNEYAIQHFKNVLKAYQNTIRSLAINSNIRNIDIRPEIRSFNNLERLGLFVGVDSRDVILKTRQPLKWFYFVGHISDDVITKCQQVSLNLIMPATKFTKAQFLRLIADRALINIGDLTEEDIFEFIKSWQNGTIGRDIEQYEWILDNSKFDVSKMFSFFGIEYNGHERTHHVIKQNVEPGMQAVLSYDVSRSRIFSFMNINYNHK